MGVRDVLRIKGTPYKELGLDAAHWSDDQLIDQMVAREPPRAPTIPIQPVESAQ